jgi:hypothetical protein
MIPRKRTSESRDLLSSIWRALSEYGMQAPQGWERENDYEKPEVLTKVSWFSVNV